jgi:uncharacterized membrane protein YdfJ with MMPL/SSD domain
VRGSNYSATSPQAAGTSDLVSQLRGTAIPRATDGTGVTAYVGGPTATYIDLSNLLGSRLLPFIAVVLVIGIAALLRAFRSVAIPLTAAVLTCCRSAPPSAWSSRCSSSAGPGCRPGRPTSRCR